MNIGYGLLIAFAIYWIIMGLLWWWVKDTPITFNRDYNEGFEGGLDGIFKIEN